MDSKRRCFRESLFPRVGTDQFLSVSKKTDLIISHLAAVSIPTFGVFNTCVEERISEFSLDDLC